MIKAASVCIFLSVLTYSVSADPINCYTCVDGDISIFSQSAKTHLARASLPTPPSDIKCSDPIDKTTTVKVDNAKESCVKIDLEVYSNNQTIEGTIRMTIPRDTCPKLEDEFHSKVDDDKAEIWCWECATDKCNSASIAQISFLMILAPALASLMRS